MINIAIHGRAPRLIAMICRRKRRGTTLFWLQWKLLYRVLGVRSGRRGSCDFYFTESMSGSQALGATDRTPFTGPRTPVEIKLMVKSLKNLDKDTFRKLLKAAVSLIEGNEVPESTFTSLASDNLSAEFLGTVFAGICTTLRCALRLPVTALKPENFKEDLKELRVPKEFIADFSSAVYGAKRQTIEGALVTNRCRLPSLDRMRWRLDVGISTSALNRVLEPTIVMEMTLSDGRMHNFEVPVSKFHEMRYNVAFVLKEMEALEKRSILKIE